MKQLQPAQRRTRCTLCGREIGMGETYWTINGARICEDCLDDYARMDYFPCRAVRGKEASL